MLKVTIEDIVTGYVIDTEIPVLPLIGHRIYLLSDPDRNTDGDSCIIKTIEYTYDELGRFDKLIILISNEQD
jgi:hypothetical protein